MLGIASAGSDVRNQRTMDVKTGDDWVRVKFPQSRCGCKLRKHGNDLGPKINLRQSRHWVKICGRAGRCGYVSAGNELVLQKIDRLL